MLYTYTTGRNLYGQLTNDTTTANLSNGDTHINAYTSQLLSKRVWPFLFRDDTSRSTIANQQYVTIPNKFRKITRVTITQGTTIWTPKEVPNKEFWSKLNSQTATSNTSDIPEWFYVFNGRIYLWPTPATSGNTVTITGRIGFNRLNIADYTTGAVWSVGASGTAVTGTATAWHAGMADRYIRITDGNSANSGDDEWYEISSVSGATTLAIVKPYDGTAIVGASGTAAYTIGQVSPIPDGYQEAPIYHAAYIYYSSQTTPGAGSKANEYKIMRDELVEQFITDYGSETDNVTIRDEDISDNINPNLFVRL